jgi:hypothetical protein
MYCNQEKLRNKEETGCTDSNDGKVINRRKKFNGFLMKTRWGGIMWSGMTCACILETGTLLGMDLGVLESDGLVLRFSSASGERRTSLSPCYTYSRPG